MTIFELRKCAHQIWEASLEAGRPDTCIPNAIEVCADGFAVDGTEYKTPGRLIVIGAGKAGAGMARVVEGIFGARISAGLVITKHGHGLATEYIQVLEAGHPIPDQSGVLGVEGIREILRDLDPEDVVLCLLSGGGSALLPAPAEGITLGEKQEVTTLLLRAGATIRELNAVRKHLSAIKGGQLLRWATPARVVALIMSDVIGDPRRSPKTGQWWSPENRPTNIDKPGTLTPTGSRNRLRRHEQCLEHRKERASCCIGAAWMAAASDRTDHRRAS